MLFLSRRFTSGMSTADTLSFGEELHVAIDHAFHQLFVADFGFPAENLPGLARVADKQVDFGRAEELRVHPHDDLLGALEGGVFLDSAVVEFEFHASSLEGEVDELANLMRLAGGNDEVVGHGLLQHEPHGAHVVGAVSPVAACVQVAQFKHVLQAGLDFGDGNRNLAGHEFCTAAFGFVVKENARAGEHAVAFAVVLGNPVAVQLGHTVGAARVEGRIFVLRNGLHLAEHLAGARLVHAGVGLAEPDGF